ncbi:MAG: hypothetical protein WBA18_06675 [Terracidiphilus sp.]
MARRFGALEVEDALGERGRDVHTAPETVSFTWRQREGRGHDPAGNLGLRTHDRMIEMEPGMVESWLMAMKIVANGLLWTSVLLASGLLLTWLVYLVHWRAGLF